MNAPYRQVFTLDVKGPIVGVTEIDFRNHGFQSTGHFDLQENVELSWTAPEPIIEVPQNFAAVVLDSDGGRWVRFASHWEYEDDSDTRFEDSDIAEHLSKHGWKILTNGVEA